MNLLQRNGDTDSGQHRMHHHRGDGQCVARNLAEPQQYLHCSRTHGNEACQSPTELVDQLRDHDGEAGRWATHLQRRPTQGARENASDNGGDEARHDRRARGDGNTDRQRDGDEKDDQRGRNVVSENACHTGPRSSALG